MENAIENLLTEIKNDYARYQEACSGGEDLTAIQAKMREEFNKGLHTVEGKKYIKILKEGSVWGFVVNVENDKFRYGDILKAASYNAPARNKPRGNVIDKDFSWVRWTGPEYL